MLNLRSVFGTCCLAIAFAPPSLAETRVGAAAVKITPPNGTPLAGYYHARAADGVLDDLYAKALVIERDREQAAIVVLDLISTTRPLVERARAEIERKTGIKADRVLISATHTHTGPELASRGRRADEIAAQNPLIEQYSEKLPSLIVQAVAEAHARLAPAQISAGVARQERLSFNRRFRMRDGSVGWNPGKRNPNIDRPAGETDPEVGVLYIESTEQMDGRPLPVATFVNFAMHPDTTSGKKVSADYPGALARVLAGYRGAEMVTLFANGACGDVNHIDVKWAGRQGGPEEAHRIGVILGAAVMETYKNLRPIGDGPLRSKSETVVLPLAAVTPDEVESARNLVKASDNAPPTFLQRVNAYKVLDVAAREGKPLEVEVQVIRLGREVAWVSLPGEAFVELGLAIKKRSPFRYTFIAELANGSIGYIPDRESFAEGNYEPISARCAAGSGELLVETAVRLLAELSREPAAPPARPAR